MSLDSLDFVIDKYHSCKVVDLEDEVMRQHILDVCLDKAAKEGGSYEELSIDYACTIYARLLASYLKFDKEQEIEYKDGGVAFKRRS